ncbi:LIC13259/LIC11441 family protein [Leptospira ilyithenensis]|uniref:DUF3347 domain-containing protein n=1 Tax=Leptospira ilyithenensis TaxID=2484901 RepID=A0A4R9LW64_9LEPT|nr:DUF3347 domain-containing protein [Leptospira ilyithenensis]TGN13352.1 DUF3347 domain-containing protein [Leptospira ilyithenensis]
MKTLITTLFISIAVCGSLYAHAGKETFVLEEVARIHTELFEGKTGTIDTKKLVELLKADADRKKDTSAFKQALPFAEQLGKATNEVQKRELFYRLSSELESIVGHHDQSGVSVFYCPMLKKKWIAKGKEIRNPYLANMKNCGQIVND